MTPEQAQEIARLRALNVSPKLIARQLGLRPSDVSAQIRVQAQQLSLDREATGALAPIEACWVNTTAYSCLLKPDVNLSKEERGELDGGLAVVLVARKAKYNQYTICTYLVDYWCLGIKDAMGPRNMKQDAYQRFLDVAYQGFDGDRIQISLEQAQAIVFSALNYATSLGFSPHKDFEAAQALLGDWDQQQTIECGRNGQPCFFSGPNDNSSRIMETLTKNVGAGNFDYVAEISGMP